MRLAVLWRFGSGRRRPATPFCNNKRFARQKDRGPATGIISSYRQIVPKLYLVG